MYIQNIPQNNHGITVFFSSTAAAMEKTHKPTAPHPLNYFINCLFGNQFYRPDLTITLNSFKHYWTPYIPMSSFCSICRTYYTFNVCLRFSLYFELQVISEKEAFEMLNPL